MLTQTSVTAVRILIHLGQKTAAEVTSLKQVAEELGESPSYLVKIARHLVRAGILRAHRGKTGGVMLNRTPKQITLLSIVEACQGIIHGTFCQEMDRLERTCGLHRAGAELHQAITRTLGKWTLADLMDEPCPAREIQGKVSCLLLGGRAGIKQVPQRSRT